jgi:hypothetical protein
VFRRRDVQLESDEELHRLHPSGAQPARREGVHLPPERRPRRELGRRDDAHPDALGAGAPELLAHAAAALDPGEPWPRQQDRHLADPDAAEPRQRALRGEDAGPAPGGARGIREPRGRARAEPLRCDGSTRRYPGPAGVHVCDGTASPERRGHVEPVAHALLERLERHGVGAVNTEHFEHAGRVARVGGEGRAPPACGILGRHGQGGDGPGRAPRTPRCGVGPRQPPPAGGKGGRTRRISRPWGRCLLSRARGGSMPGRQALIGLCRQLRLQLFEDQRFRHVVVESRLSCPRYVRGVTRQREQPGARRRRTAADRRPRRRGLPPPSRRRCGDPLRRARRGRSVPAALA